MGLVPVHAEIQLSSEECPDREQVEPFMQFTQEGKYPEAIRVAEEMLATVESTKGPDAPEIMQPLILLGIAQDLAGETKKADRVFRRAMALKSPAAASVACFSPIDLSESRAPVADILWTLAVWSWLSDRGKHEETVWRRILKVQEATLGSTHPDLAPPLSSLGELAGEAGRVEEGETLLLRALDIFDKAPPDELKLDHISDVKADIGWLAKVYNDQGRIDEAKKLRERVEAAFGRLR
jgi:tetratricopeptide (TPR) repeat protein